MKKKKKFIKYSAIVFGIYLSITIVMVLLSLAGAFTGIPEKEVENLIKDSTEYKEEDISKEFENVKSLEIDLETMDLVIRNGDKIKVEGTNIPDRMRIKQEGEKLKISDEEISSSYLGDNTITIYLPENQKLDNINLEIKYSTVEIEKINVSNLKLDFESNYCEFQEIVADNIEIDNEYADLDIYDGQTTNFRMDSESGYQNIALKITGTGNVEVENADTNITLIGKQEDYQINNKNRLGTTYIGDEAISNNQTIGSGNGKINLDIKSTDIYIEFEEINNESYTIGKLFFPIV